MAARYVLVRRADPQIHDWSDETRGDVSFRTLIDGAAQPTGGLVQGIGFLPRGGEEKRHHHDIPETLHVIAGIGVAELEGERVDLAPGDTVYVPPGLVHAWTAPEEPLRFLYTFPADRFSDVAYHFGGPDDA